MIKINVDEAAAFDALSILRVKIVSGMGGCDEAYDRLESDIIYSLGNIELFGQILKSAEYRNLIDINNEIFYAIENYLIDGEDWGIQELNQKRYLCKKQLQDRFFTTALTEQKNG